MVDSAKFLSFVLALCLATKGSCQECNANNIPVEQAKTGIDIQGQPQWKVTVFNNCNCSRFDIVLHCPGFKSVEPVDTFVLAVRASTSECLLISGSPIKPFGSTSFTYASFPPNNLTPEKWDTRC